ncbi:MAG: hypothetical protein SVU32_08185 [Candidatus Nanohaloarchaea archaeon]|nr:hypothetical protein [Candidatus Nanohaloarchaea archaeon]
MFHGPLTIPAARIELPVRIESGDLHGYFRNAFDRYDRAVVSGPHSVGEDSLITQYRSDDGDISVLMREESSYDHLALDGTEGNDAVYEEFRDCMMAALGELNLLDI